MRLWTVLICLFWTASLVPALGLLVFFHLSWPLALFEEEDEEEEERKRRGRGEEEERKKNVILNKNQIRRLRNRLLRFLSNLLDDISRMSFIVLIPY